MSMTPYGVIVAIAVIVVPVTLAPRKRSRIVMLSDLLLSAIHG